MNACSTQIAVSSRCSGETVTTQPKAFELLLYLVRNRSRAVDKDELQDALWPRSIVTETALTRCVMKARRAVGDDADKQAVIKTVHGHGYRFVADIREAPPTEPAASAVTSVHHRPRHANPGSQLLPRLSLSLPAPGGFSRRRPSAAK